jgi:glycerol transport system ATP-binding protein
MNLVAENLSYKPDEQFHLNEVSFNFKKGNIYTILGRTLSGKTTLLKTIAGLLTPDSGDMQFEDKDFLKVPVWERNIAMVYQQFINYPHLNVFENVAFPLKQRKVDDQKLMTVVLKSLKSVGLEGYENRKIQELSGWATAKSFSCKIFSKECKDIIIR